MKSIITWAYSTILNPVPILDLSSIPGKPRGKLRLSPEQLLAVIHAPVLAEWALWMTRLIGKPRLPRGPGGRPPTYPDSGILLMAVVQTAWRKSYEQMVDWVATNETLALALGFTHRTLEGKLQTISKGQYWERRQALGVLPFLFFFLALVAQLIRLGAITGKELIVDSTLLRAWSKADPGAAWQQYAGKAHVFGYKVHTVLCRQANLPVFVLVTPANVHDSLVGWLIVLVAALVYGFRVLVVYADAAYFDRRFFWVVFDILGAHAAVDYNLRRAGKRKLADPFFLRQWWRLVIRPRSDIERHFAWIKRYFGLKYFQCFTFCRVSQFVLLTYIAALAVALAAQRYDRPELVRSRSLVLAHV
jgi:hypothetical protein